MKKKKTNFEWNWKGHGDYPICGACLFYFFMIGLCTGLIIGIYIGGLLK